MKRPLLLILLTALSVNLMAQWHLGVYRTRYAAVGYTFHRPFTVEASHSIFAEIPGLQHVRIAADYHPSAGRFDFSVNPCVGMTWRNSFHDAALRMGVAYTPLHRLKLQAALCPHYDSGYGYTTCYEGGLSVSATDEISIEAAWSTIPEYRAAERRVRLGLRFHVSRLEVLPQLSVPAEGEIKSVRVLAGLRYTFPRRHAK